MTKQEQIRESSLEFEWIHLETILFQNYKGGLQVGAMHCLQQYINFSSISNILRLKLMKRMINTPIK